jgi:hypothetical protein
MVALPAPTTLAFLPRAKRASMSSIPVFLREKSLKEQLWEMQRYKAVISDSAIPFQWHDILTNELKGVPYFEVLMKPYDVSGSVQVVPSEVRGRLR